MNTPVPVRCAHLPSFRRVVSATLVLSGVFVATPFARVADQTITGNLAVTGTVDVDGNSLFFGTQGASPGLSLTYTDAAADTLTFFLNRATASWLWAHSSAIAAMRLTGEHELVLYHPDGQTAGVTLTPGGVPNGPSILLGGVRLYGGPSSFLMNGNVTVAGTLTSQSMAFQGGQFVWGGPVAGLTLQGSSGLAFNSGSGALSFTTGGSNQNITFTPSGAGMTLLNGNVALPSGRLGIGASAPATKLAVSGSPGVDSAISINNTAFLSAHAEPRNRVTMLGTNLYWSGSAYVAPNITEPGLSLELHQGANAFVFARRPEGIGAVDVIESLIGASGTHSYFNVRGGNVGIGTEQPARKLTVRGDMEVDGPILIAPQGDLPMGAFTQGPRPTL